MPKSTFFNLPKDKQEHIFRHAMEEFARHPYEQASLSEIVKKAGIAKGSMYQYFSGKKDLYKYVVQQVYRHKREYLQPVWELKDKIDFFRMLSMYYRRSWHYAQAYPTQHKVIVNFWDSKDAAVREEILREKQTRINVFVDLLEHGSRSGVIDPGIDKETAWFVYHAVARDLIDNFLDPGIDIHSHEAFIDSVLAILELGLRPRKE